MSNEKLNWLITWGPLVGLVFAVLAAVTGVISGYAGRELSRRSDARLAVLATQVGTVIGGTWDPLTSAQVEELRARIAEIKPKVPPGRAPIAQVMYENAFGKDLAGSIALAFRAAGWSTTLGPGNGFESGIKLGRGPIGPILQKIIEDVTHIHDVTALGPQEPDLGFYFVGVGAKTQ